MYVYIYMYMQGFCFTSAQVEKYEAGLTDQQWREHLWHIWFQRHPSSAKCGFEHVFIGEATEDSLAYSDPYISLFPSSCHLLLVMN